MLSEDVVDTVKVSTEAWPVVVIALPRRITVPTIDTLFTQVEAIYARREPYVLITDTRLVDAVPGAVERKRLAELLGAPVHVTGQEKWNLGSVTILHNALLRGAMQAVYWLWTPPRPHRPARDFDEAWALCARWLGERGIALPKSETELRRLARRALER